MKKHQRLRYVHRRGRGGIGAFELQADAAFAWLLLVAAHLALAANIADRPLRFRIGLGRRHAQE